MYWLSSTVSNTYGTLVNKKSLHTLEIKEDELKKLTLFLDKLSIEEYYEYEYGLFLKNTNNHNLPFVSFYPSELKVLENKIKKEEEEILENIKVQITELAKKYSDNLKNKIDNRMEEMKDDDKSHYLIYQVLGISDREGHLIDLYQNKGRFLYKYAGSFLEEATKLCFLETFPESATTKIPNTSGTRPKTFEIDCLEGNNAIEIKWRDATTDGDHITKEHTRIKVIHEAGYQPIRVMFYYPNRTQAMKIQNTLETLYKGIGGEYYYGDSAWEYVKTRTTIDLKQILEDIAKENLGA
jgi:hypothetical protein